MAVAYATGEEVRMKQNKEMYFLKFTCSRTSSQNLNQRITNEKLFV